MSDNIDRLKQLLFDSETQTLAELSQSIEILFGQTSATHSGLAKAIQDLSASHGRSREEISARIDAIAARVERDADLEASVAAVLDGAFRRAETARHADVADAVAPFVVNTVRTEIRNSKDELVEALYPVTGRIVKSYVASAMKDLVDQINRRLESNALMLRLRSLATGRSVAELAIADSQRLHVEELYLIRRGTGELVERWPEDRTHNRDQVMSGVLTAINEFASEAFDTDGQTLRQIDLGSSRVYLRDSVSYLLAAKCSGTASPAIQAVLDDAFLTAIGRLGSSARDDRPPVLASLAEQLTPSLEDAQSAAAGPAGFSPVKMLAAIIGVPLVAWGVWTLYADWRVSRTEHIAHAIIAQSDEIRGYPAKIAVGRLGETLTITGLAPTSEAKRQVIARLSEALPGVAITDELTTVPNALANVEPELDRLRGKADELSRSIVAEADNRDRHRALDRLGRAEATLAALAADLPAELKPAAKSALASMDQIRADARKADVASLQPALARVEAAVAQLRPLLAAPVKAGTAIKTAQSPAAAMLSTAEEVETIVNALAQSIALKKALPASSPREKLEAWTRANAIFFSEDANYRDPASAKRKIAELAALMSGNDLTLRIIGYTDGLGGTGRNSPLSLTRANEVASDLAAAGINRDRLIVVGRPNLRDISPEDGTGSPNRRVEFEVGFEGEAR